MSFRKQLFVSLVAGFLSTGICWAGGNARAESEARRLLGTCSTKAGVACVPDCGDGELALKLARESEFLILAMDEDPANVAAAKEKAAEAGLLGRRLYVEQGSPDTIPFAENYVDLLVLSDVREADISEALRAEIMRVLTPINGRAVLADATISKPELPGSDWWMHKLHAPNNNQVSRDTAFEWPPVLQFRAMPFYMAHSGTSLTDSGVHVEIHDWALKNPERSNLCGRVFARNVYNGRLLWDAVIPENVESNAPLYAIADGKLFLGSGTRAEVAVRELFTGEEQSPISLGGEDRRIKWLAVNDGVLFALLGDPAKVRRPFAFALQPPVFQKQEAEHTLFGDQLLAWDLRKGKVLWAHTEPKPIDFRAVALHEGKLYFYSENQRLACMDAADGKSLWQNADRSWIGSLRRPAKIRNHNIRHMSTLKVADGLIHLALMEANQGFLFREEDGKLLSPIEAPGWSGRYVGNKTFILDGRCYRGTAPLDPETGEKGSEHSVPSPAGLAWCGIATYAPGTGAIGHSTLGYKSPCGIGSWVAGGVLLYSPTVCGCGTIPGAAGFTSGGQVLSRIESAPEAPLVKGPAFSAVDTSAPKARPQDWTAYRGDSRHRGSSPIELGAALTTAWTAEPASPFAYTTKYNQFVDEFDERPTPPTVARDLVFSAGSDGVVRADRLSDGRPVWTYSADGPVFTSPAFADGRLFVPCMDGWVYALDARSGQLAWKRRLAPMERRIHVFDQLMSTWPVLSLAVQDGVVYAAAGMLKMDASKAFGLDAETGEIMWSHYTPPGIAGTHLESKERSFGFNGHTAVVGDYVWISGYRSMPLTLDRKTGALPELSEKFEAMRRAGGFTRLYETQGRDLVVMDDKTVLAGGGHLLENQHLREGKRVRIDYKMFTLTDDGAVNMSVPPPRILKVSRVAPACDDELVVFAAPPPTTKNNRGQVKNNYKMSMSTVGLNVWKKQDFLQEGRQMQKNPLIDEESSQPGRVGYTRWGNVFRDFDYPRAAWQKPDLEVSAVALSGDAVLVGHATGFEEPLGWNPPADQARTARIIYKGWQLSAFDRESGEERWSAPLPAEPLPNGICIAADGSVIVALRDGRLVCFRSS